MLNQTVKRWSGSDLDELALILSTPHCQWNVSALDKNPATFRASFVSTGGITVAECAYNVSLLLEREGHSDRLLVFLPTMGNAFFEDGQTQVLSTPGRGTILEAAHNSAARLFGPRHHLGLFVDRQKLTTHLTHLLERPTGGSLDFRTEIDLTDGPGLALAQLVETARSGLGDGGSLQRSPLALAALGDAICYLLIETLPNRYSDELARSAPAPAPRHVKSAIDFMHGSIAKPISLHDIATAAKVSVRTLQTGFRQFRNISPWSYLREIRMVAARHDLLAGDKAPTVSDVAVKWGFAHLGRFSVEYKKRFGESPSQTLKARSH
ncbi:AraC family transcriptional regulator [Rhizobium ecuadorense]|uniref:AraC family transcriptional regulator n=1 Tax=Rhizobium ecuadorense TaxID=1671795 RepID=UPI0009EB03EF|nr:helix-turn-helix domain-containing protein [Rhizobium ecuadorense]